MDKNLKITLIGGDLRQVSLAQMLVSDGRAVGVCGLGEGDLGEIAVPLSDIRKVRS